MTHEEVCGLGVQWNARRSFAGIWNKDWIWMITTAVIPATMRKMSLVE